MSISIIKPQSNAHLGVIGLEVELLSRSTKTTRNFAVEVIYVCLELTLALRSSQIERESLRILNYPSLLIGKPSLILLIQEVTIPSLITQYTKVLKQFKRN